MTAATPEARAHARRLRAARVANNPDRLCPPDHKHGLTGTCYSGHGCRCLPCREARARYKRREYYAQKQLLRADVKVPVLGAQRRLQALAVMGWSPAALADELNMVPRLVGRIREGLRAHVMLSTHRRVDAVYRRLMMVEAVGHSAWLTKAHARKQGWVSGLAWENIDDPRDAGRARPRCSVDACLKTVQVAGLCYEHLEAA